MANKWINDCGFWSQVSGDVVLHITPGPGVYEVVQPKLPTDRTIGLVKLFDKFEFPGKFYQIGPKRLLDRIKKVWWSDKFDEEKKSLGVILNGLKGSGKTWMAKQISNEMDMPVLLVNSAFEGDILGFIRNINFSCTILVDEAEKTFKLGDEDDILLRMIDSATSNYARHLFILTTNTLDVNPNLLGRTGRIRYLINFKNLPEEVVKEYIDDNLDPKYTGLKDQIMDKVNLLEYNSIDLLKAIIEEVNITGEVDSPDDEMMNIPLCRYAWDILEFEGLGWSDLAKVKKIIQENKPEEKSIVEWLKEDWEGDKKNMDRFEEISGCEYAYTRKITSRYSHIWKDCELSCGTVLMEPDKDLFFSYVDQYSKDETLALILEQKKNPGLYRSNLVF
ncbi:MAG: AAA family ATPase [Bacilli bacterium]|nr:AAA family ATPase [Bacilli bacterium]